MNPISKHLHGADFINNVNVLANNINVLLKLSDLLKDGGVEALEKFDPEVLEEIGKDIAKGTYRGNRQILINTKDFLGKEGYKYNIIDIDKKVVSTHDIEDTDTASFLISLRESLEKAFPKQLNVTFDDCECNSKVIRIVDKDDNIMSKLLEIRVFKEGTESFYYNWFNSTSSISYLIFRMQEFQKMLDALEELDRNEYVNSINYIYKHIEEILVISDNLDAILNITESAEYLKFLGELINQNTFVVVVNSVEELEKLNTQYFTIARIQERFQDSVGFSDYVFDKDSGKWLLVNTTKDIEIKESRVEQHLIKKDLSSPCFIKKNANTVAIKAGTAIGLKNGEIVRYDKDEVVKLEGYHIRGSDYAIYADRTGALHAVVDNFESPAIIPGDAVLIGGYHYSLVPETETVASGEFATTGDGMIWTQADVDRIRGINEFSLWDIRFRAGGIIASPLSPRFGQLSNHSMAFDRTTNRWYALFHVSSDVDKFGVSRAGTDIASGTVLPVIPSAFNGNGVKKYDNLNWWTANELVTSQGARLLYEFEFNNRAFGVTEKKVAYGPEATYPKTERVDGLTSKIGCEQATGVQYYWGLESSYRSDDGSWKWKEITGGRGGYFIQNEYGAVKSLFGGDRLFKSVVVGSDEDNSVGSRCVLWVSFPWVSNWSIGAVATRDLLIL